MNKKQEYQKAYTLIEKWRYRFEIDKMVRLFVAQWAYQCTGLYPPQDAEVQTEEFEEVAKPLSQILANLMLNGVSDPLAVILSEFCKSDAKHVAYYPTPSEVGQLIAQLLGQDEEPGNNERISIYEPCCGSAGIIMEKLERVFYKNAHLNEPLSNVSITVEDINSVAVQSFCIQLIFKIKYLSLVSGKACEPFEVDINQVDVIGRREGPIRYLFTRT